MQERERNLPRTLAIPDTAGDFEMQMKYEGNLTCGCLQASLRLVLQSLPRPGTVTSVWRAVALLVQALFFPYTPENPEQNP